MEKQMIWVIAALTLMVVAVSGQGGALNVTQSCQILDGGVVQITVTLEQPPPPSDLIQLVAVVRETNGQFHIPGGMWCESAQNGDSAVLSVKADFANEYQLDPLVAAKDCALSFDLDTVSMFVLPTTSIDVYTAFYPLISVSCNTTGPPQNIANEFPITDFDSLPTQLPTDATLPTLDCVFIDEDRTVITSIQFGKTFEIKCTSTTGDEQAGFAISNFILASNLQGTGRTVTLFDDNGCVDRNHPHFQAFTDPEDPLLKTLDFVDSVPYDPLEIYEFNDTSILSLEYTVGPILGHMLIPDRPNTNNDPTLVLMFDYAFTCGYVHELMCADQEQHCMDTGNYNRPRGKRSDNEVYKAGTMKLEITLTGDREDGGTERIAQNTAATNSVDPTFYWMVGAILGVLLILVIIVCVVLALRLRRERLYKDEAFERDGHKNPAYN